ncbi:hypothetical protein AOQ84DRAFT_384624 [Glonium stellatum]|uniref:Uncharacterized protein n=1 Tax=Glonium stellatum TaxID=574774 RepID=A0A8E2FCE7_9PEZI|nr:hypothetical protein AOQ84DRAFT_384624 [Glonium stellatum]
MQYRCVNQGTAGKFSLSPTDLPQSIGSDGAVVCFIFFLPTLQGNCLVAHINSDRWVRNDPNNEKYKEIVQDANRRVTELLNGDTVDPQAAWYTIENNEKGLASAITDGIREATRLSKPISGLGEGFVVTVKDGKPGEPVWAKGNGPRGFEAIAVDGSTMWTNVIGYGA